MVMRKLILLVLFLINYSGLYAQKTLVVEKIGTMTRYGFHLGDDVKIQTKTDRLILKSYIWELTDSSVTIGIHHTVPLTDVGAVYKYYHFPNLLTKFFFIAGGGYFVLDSFNNMINKEKIFNPQTFLISCGLVAVGCAIIPLHQKKCRIGIKWRLKVMDINLN
jgi:hypothetical protein